MKNIILLILGLSVTVAWAKIDPTKAVNRSLLTGIATPANKILAQHGIVAQPSDETQLYDLYQSIQKSGVPMLVTTDCALHQFHVLFDYTLREIETKFFCADLKKLTTGLLTYELNAQKSSRNGMVKTALNDNIAFLSVAAALLDPNFKPPQAVAKTVDAELKLIAEHAGSAKSPLAGYDEDYSQYVPRGHYTRTKELSRYFQAMMWYGRIGFPLKPGNSAEDIARGRKLTLQAILLTMALRKAIIGGESALTIWNRIYEVTTFLVGKSDDLNVLDYYHVGDMTFGENKWHTALGDTTKLNQFIDAALKLPSPLIVSQVVPDTLNPQQTTKGFRLMGQRFILDSYIFQELVYNKVGTMAEPRMMPKGLDVMAALGSDQARKILREIYKENRYENYDKQMEKLRAQFAQFREYDWNQNIYFGWLYALKLQNEPVPANKLLPEFCFQPAYADKCLVTTCGSWAQLRHDTILYAKQSYTMLATAIPQREDEKPQPVVFVEPRPEVFKQIGGLSNRLAKWLEKHGVLGSELKMRLEEFEALCDNLLSYAEMEVAGQQPDSGIVNALWRIGDDMESLSEFPGTEEYTNEEDRSMEIVADVHTDPNTETVLEVAVGRPLIVTALVLVGGKQYLAQGGMFSYYEFANPMSDRLSDKQWQETSPKPPMPEWTKSFVTE